jgi:outer membrane biogenesis lipoprotein LolB
MVKQVLAIVALSLLAACTNPIAQRDSKTMIAKWDTTAKVVDTTLNRPAPK